MLVLQRNLRESIIIGDNDIKITILRVDGNQVSLGIAADKNIDIHREEVFLRIKAEKGGEEAEADADTNYIG